MNPAADHYFVKFTVSSCRFDLRINDIPLLRFPGTGSVSTRFYINQYVQSGKNVASINMLPTDAEGFVPTSHATIFLGHLKDGKETMLAEGAWRWDPDKPEPARILITPFVLQALIQPVAPWQKTVPEQLTNQRRADIIQRFRQILDAFQKKDLERVMFFAAPRDAFFEERYQWKEGQRTVEIRAAFSNLFKSCEFFAHQPDQWIFKTYADERIFTFELANFNSPVEFHKTGTEMKANVPVLLCFDDKGDVKWVL